MDSKVTDDGLLKVTGGDEPIIMAGGMAVDDRGSLSFVQHFDFDGVKRFYQVSNHKRGFVRAWHGHKKEAKYVYACRGTAMVGLVKMGEEDATPSTFILSSNKPEVLFIPPGYYNGFQTLEEGTSLMFFSTATLGESMNDDIRKDWNTWDIWGDCYR